MQNSESQITSPDLPVGRIPIEEINQINFTHILLHKAEHNDHCIYCGKQMSPGDRTRDHIVPRSRIHCVSNPFFRSYFGTLNIVYCCVSCNRLKGKLTLRHFAMKVQRMMVPNRETMLSNIRKLLIAD